MANKNDKRDEFIKMASEIKSECEKFPYCENCPYDDEYCVFEKIFGNSPCTWDLEE